MQSVDHRHAVGRRLTFRYGHIVWSMAIPKVKGTYSLDVETAKLIADAARELGTSKSEVLRRAIHDYAAKHLHKASPNPLDALQHLQDGMKLGSEEAVRWAEQVQTERESFPPEQA